MKVVRISKHNQVFFDLMKTEDGKKQLMEMTRAHNEWLAKLKGEGKFIEKYCHSIAVFGENRITNDKKCYLSVKYPSCNIPR